MFQIAVLLQFNDAMLRTMTELMDSTLLPKEVLQQVTQILVKYKLLVWYMHTCKYKYLCKHIIHVDIDAGTHRERL